MMLFSKNRGALPENITSLALKAAAFLETGIPGGEICAFRVADLDLDKPSIHVHQSVLTEDFDPRCARFWNVSLPSNLLRANSESRLPFWGVPWLL
jgi:integrase